MGKTTVSGKCSQSVGKPLEIDLREVFEAVGDHSNSTPGDDEFCARDYAGENGVSQRTASTHIALAVERGLVVPTKKYINGCKPAQYYRRVTDA